MRDEVKGRSAPQNRSFASVEEMKKAIGTEVGVSGWLEISQQVLYFPFIFNSTLLFKWAVKLFLLFHQV